MPKQGLQRYVALFQNIQNPFEYILHKGDRKKRALEFITKPNNIKFKVPESLYQVFKEIFMADVYHIQKLTQLLPNNPVVIDIGANAGFFDILLLSKLNNASIYAYEPIPSNIQLLQKTAEQNLQLQKQLSIQQLAVTGLPGSGLDLYMEDTNDNQVVASVFNGFNKSNTKKITIPSITLSEIIEQTGSEQIHLLKMDCEGSEYDIIYNTPASILRKIQFMSIEVHDIDDKQNNIRYFNSFIQKLGYQTQFSPINNFCYAFEASRL